MSRRKMFNTVTAMDYAINEIRGIKMSRRKMFNTITVMDYCFNEIRVYRNVETDDPEKWLEEHDEHWHESTCYYMYGEDTEVKEYGK